MISSPSVASQVHLNMILSGTYGLSGNVYAATRKTSKTVSDNMKANTSTNIKTNIMANTATNVKTNIMTNTSSKMMVESAEKKTVNNKSIFFMKKTTYVLKKGKKVKLRYLISSRYKNKKIIWTSSKKSVATVSKTGVIKGKKYGKTVIKARIKGTKYVAKCVLIVGHPVSAIKVSSRKISMKKGTHTPIKIKIIPSNASRKKVKYASSNKKIAKVSPNGVITAIDAGKAKIKITSTDGHNITTYLYVNVKNKNNTNVNKSKSDKSDNSNASDYTNASDNSNASDQAMTSDDSTESSKTTESSQTSETTEDQTQPSTSKSWDDSQFDIKAADITLTNSQRLLIYMEKYSAFIKKFGKLCYKSKIATVSSYEEALKAVLASTDIGINCVSPLNWALREMGLETNNGEIHGTYNNGFVIQSTGTQTLLNKNATFIGKENDAIGMSVQEAAENGYLKAGDALSINKYIENVNYSHTAVYYGLSSEGHAIVYESGNIPYNLGYSVYGCGPLDYSGYDTFYITEIMRLN